MHDFLRQSKTKGIQTAIRLVMASIPRCTEIAIDRLRQAKDAFSRSEPMAEIEKTRVENGKEEGQRGCHRCRECNQE